MENTRPEVVLGRGPGDGTHEENVIQVVKSMEEMLTTPVHRRAHFVDDKIIV